MSHPLVAQLRFTRHEFERALDGVSEADGAQRVGPMNSLSWIVGHLAWHEHVYWLDLAQGTSIAPQLHDLTASGQPATVPSLAEMWATWRAVVAASDPYLDTLTSATLQSHFEHNGRPLRESIGTQLRRLTYHYWYHIGEAQAIRQALGHADLPGFVGDIHTLAPYRPESAE